MKINYVNNRFLLFIGVMAWQLLPVVKLWSTTHVILFGGGVGLNYSPNSLAVATGDTISWQGNFSLHPLVSTSFPIGAASWSASSGTVFNYPVLIAGSYDYQCDVHFGSGMTGSFTATGPPPIGTPNLLAPAVNSKGVSITPTLRWNNTAGATSYHLQMSTTSDFSGVVQEDSSLVDSSKQAAALSFNTTYYWRVRAKDGASAGGWSVPFYFTTLRQPATHTILFGGLVGFQYSPQYIEAIVGDTLRWQGDFSLHPLSSTAVPVGASPWHVESGTGFNYPLLTAGPYRYQCDFHFSSGMVGSVFAVDYSPLGSPGLLLPANNSVGIPIDPVIRWNSLNNAPRYHYQISTSSAFLTIVEEDTLVADTTKQITGLSNDVIYYWRVRGINLLALGPWSSQRNFRTIQTFPSVPILSQPDSGSVDLLSTVWLAWNHVSVADSYYVQLSTDSLFNTIDYANATADTSLLVTNLGKDSTYYWRVSSKNNAGISTWSVIWKFATSVSIFSVSVAINSQWNMVSVPVLTDDGRKEVLFPNASSSAFYYSAGYLIADSLEKGKGYWMEFDSAQTVVVSGNSLLSDTVTLSVGWNMIGSISIPIPASSLTSVPGGIVTSTFFAYDGSRYVEADSIKPGYGYWVKTNQSGKLILSSVPLQATASRIVIKPAADRPPSPPAGGTENRQRQLPGGFSLAQNHPNPFNPATSIQFHISDASFVTLKVFNLVGQEVATLVDGKREAGRYDVAFDAGELTSGIYLCRLTAGNFMQTRKLVLVK